MDSLADRLVDRLTNSGVRHRRLMSEEHLGCERQWWGVFADALRLKLRHRHGAKAVHEYLSERADWWLLVPFLSNVPGIPVHMLHPRPSAFECHGPLLELGEFNNIEFFISPPDMTWTFVSTHEDFALGGPYFMRADWIDRKPGGWSPA